MTAFTVLITGANRGLGLEFVKQYAQEGWLVLACCRQPQSAIALQALAAAHPNIQLFALDVGVFKQIETLAAKLYGTTIDVLINNAGIYPESDFDDCDEQQWLQAFRVNTIAPLKMAQAFITHLTKGHLKKLVTLSSKMGSIDDNTSGESYIYRSSKCAVNMVMKNLSMDLKPYGISVVTLHPGWVRTEMGGPNGLIDAPESVTGMRKVIAQLSPANTGKFIAFDGNEIAW